MPFQKGHKKMGGRTKGTPNKVTVEFREFAKELIRDKDYRDGLMKRARAGKLAPPVEVSLLHYGAGKPTETVEINATHKTSEEISTMTDEQLRARLAELAAMITAAPAETDEDSDSIH
jgi:hypothetical protein